MYCARVVCLVGIERFTVHILYAQGSSKHVDTDIHSLYERQVTGTMYLPVLSTD